MTDDARSPAATHPWRSTQMTRLAGPLSNRSKVGTFRPASFRVVRVVVHTRNKGDIPIDAGPEGSVSWAVRGQYLYIANGDIDEPDAVIDVENIISTTFEKVIT